MAVRIRFQYPTGSQLGYSIERLSDGLFYDFLPSGSSNTTGGTFVASPGKPIQQLAEDVTPFVGRFKANLTPTPASVFTDGDYVVTVHQMTLANEVVAELAVTMHNGDDATVIPQAAIDPGVLGQAIVAALKGQTITMILPIASAAVEPPIVPPLPTPTPAS